MGIASNAFGIFIVILSILFCCQELLSEELTYNQVIREAIRNSAKIKSKKQTIDVQEMGVEISKSVFYPQISANSRIEDYRNFKDTPITDPNITELIQPTSRQAAASMSLSGDLNLSFYKTIPNLYYYKMIKESAFYDCHIETKKMITEVSDIYGLLSESYLKLKYDEKILEKLNEIYNLNKESYKLGYISFEEILKLELEIDKLKNETAKDRKWVLENLSKLTVYTGVEYKGDELIQIIEIQGIDRKVVLNKGLGIEKTPEHLKGESELEALRYKYTSAKRNLLPDISFFSRYDFYGADSAFFKSIDVLQRKSFTIGIYLTMPLFDGFKKINEIKKAGYEVKAQREVVNSIRQDKEKEIKNLQSNYNQNLKLIDNYQKTLKIYNNVLDINQKAQILGEKSKIDILNIEKESISVQRDIEILKNQNSILGVKLYLETSYENFIEEFYGDRACKYRFYR